MLNRSRHCPCGSESFQRSWTHKHICSPPRLSLPNALDVQWLDQCVPAFKLRDVKRWTQRDQATWEEQLQGWYWGAGECHGGSPGVGCAKRSESRWNVWFVRPYNELNVLELRGGPCLLCWTEGLKAWGCHEGGHANCCAIEGAVQTFDPEVEGESRGRMSWGHAAWGSFQVLVSTFGLSIR